MTILYKPHGEMPKPFWPLINMRIRYLKPTQFDFPTCESTCESTLADNRLMDYNRFVADFDEMAGKIVTRRNLAGDPIVNARILLDTISRLQGGRVAPKGVWRFKTFEEADQWALDQIARLPGRPS
jgi:hypothetical protein